MRLPIGTPRDLVKELRLVGVTVAALVATFVFEHWVIHLHVVLPVTADGGEVPPWTVAAMVVPELVVLFFAGYRLRTGFSVVMLAGVGALLRGGFHLALVLAGQPGHSGPDLLYRSELAYTAPVMAIAYLLVLGLAAVSAQDERLPNGPLHREADVRRPAPRA